VVDMLPNARCVVFALSLSFCRHAYTVAVHHDKASSAIEGRGEERSGAVLPSAALTARARQVWCGSAEKAVQMWWLGQSGRTRPTQKQGVCGVGAAA